MKILKKENKLVIKDKEAYIKSCQYLVPISSKGALFISLMNGQRNYDEIVDILCEINICSASSAEMLKKNVVDQYEMFFTEDDGSENENRNYDPQKFILPAVSTEKQLNSSLPRTMLYHVTSMCDKACKYCYLDAKKGDLEEDLLKIEEVKRILDECAEMGVYGLSLSGGEPFLRRDIIDIIEYATSLGIKVNAVTKHIFSDAEVERLKGISNLELFLSYDCHIDEIASYLVGYKHFAMRMDENIKKFVANNIQFGVLPVVSGLTHQHFGDFIAHLYNLGVNKVDITRYMETFGRQENELRISDDEWYDVMETMDLLNNSMFIDITIKGEVENDQSEHPFDYDKVCRNGRLALPMLPNGKVVLCDESPNRMNYCFGDLKTESVIDVWNSEKRHRILNPSIEEYEGTACHDCSDFSRCLKKRSCINTSLLESGTDGIPVYDVRSTCIKYR